MARLVTLLQLRSDAKLYANERSSAFMSDSEWNRLVNMALAELYDLLVKARGHEYYEVSTELNTTAGSAIVALPQDFYELITLFARWNASPEGLEELDSLDHLGDQVDFRVLNTWTQFSPKAWRIRGQLLELFPTPSAVTTLEIRYVPAFQDLTADASTFDGVNGWEKLVTARAAMEALALQGLNAAGPSTIYQRERDRIEELAADRAAANPPTIRDVRGRGARGGWWSRLPWPTA